MILTYSTGALTGRFGSSSIIRDFLLSGQWQPVISPDNRGSTVLQLGAMIFCMSSILWIFPLVVQILGLTGQPVSAL
jgi:hypothetical protein